MKKAKGKKKASTISAPGVNEDESRTMRISQSLPAEALMKLEPSPGKKTNNPNNFSMLKAFDEAEANTSKLTSEYKSASPGPSTSSKPGKPNILRRAELFDQFNEDFFPLNKIRDVLVQMDKSNTVLDFTSVEQLTDIVFYTMFNLKNEFNFSRVTGVILAGCYHITDSGLTWLSTCFPELESLSIRGCSSITESGIYQTLENCTKLKHLDLTGTNVVILPRKCAGKTLSVGACPLLCPDRQSVQGVADVGMIFKESYFKPSDIDMIKVLVAKPVGKEVSFVKFLKQEQDLVGGAIELKLEHKLTEGITANLIECHEAAIDYFISKRMLCILPYGADVGISAEDIAKDLAKTVSHVLCKGPSAFVLVGLRSGAETAMPQNVKKALEKILEDTKTSIMSTTDLVKTPMKMTGLDFSDQQMLSKGLNLLHSLKFLNILTVSVDLTKTAQSQTEINKILLEGAQIVRKCYPEFQEVSKQVMSYLMSDNSKAVLMEGVVSLDESSTSNQKMIELFNMYGKAVTMQLQNSPSMVFSVEWLANVISFGLSKPTEDCASKEFFSSVHDDALVWRKDVFQMEMKKKLKMESVEKATTAAVLFHKLGFAVASSTLSTVFTNLPDTPPSTVAQMMKDSPKDMAWVKFSFEFQHFVNALVIHRITHVITEFRKPTCVWRRGCLQQEGLVDLIMNLKEEKNNTVLELKAQSPSASADNDHILTNTVKRTWQMAEQYRLAVEYVLSRMGLFYLVKSSHSQNKPDGVNGAIAGHILIYPSSDDNAIQKPMCSRCGVPIPQVILQQELMRPFPMFLKSQYIDAPEDVKISGNMVTTPKNATRQAVFKKMLDPYEQPSLMFTLIEGEPASYVFCIEATGSVPLCYVIDLRVKTIQLQVKGGEEKLLMNNLPDFEIGDVLKIQFTAGGSLEGLQEFGLCLWKGTEKFFECKCHPAKYMVKVSMSPSNPVTSVLVHGFLPSISKITTIIPKMRLEALDRLNPSLVCAATVEEVNEKGQLLIHFDGWTKRYDYWSEPDSEHLHPIGYMAVNGQTPGYTPELQPPKGYRKAFDWLTYCKEEGSLPVPYEFFNEKQLSNTPRDEENRVLMNLSLQSSENDEKQEFIMPCVESQFTSRALEFAVMKRCTMTNDVINFFSANFKFFCLLPSNLDINMLRYPSLQHIIGKDNQMIHILCPGNKMELLHFVDHPGLAVKKFKITVNQMASYVSMCFTGLILQEGFLPSCPDKIVKGASSVSLAQQKSLELQIKRMLYLYIVWLDQVDAVNKLKDISSDGHMALLTQIQNDKEACSDLGKVFNLSHGFKTTGINSCMAHSMALSGGQNMNMVDMTKFKDMYQFMQKIDFRKNGLKNLPSDFLVNFVKIDELNLSENMLKELPEGFSHTRWLTHLDISKNKITSLPNDLQNLNKVLQYLNISDNPLRKIPEVVWSLVSLTSLHANNIGKIEHLEKITNLVELEELSLASNIIDKIPKELSKLPLTYLNLSGVPWFPDLLTGKSLPTFKTFKGILDQFTVFGVMLDDKDKQELFKKIDKDNSGSLDKEEITHMNSIMFDMYPRFGINSYQYKETGGMPDVIFELKNLERLEVAFHGIKFVPDSIKGLSKFHSLNISHNPQLESLSGELGSLKMKEIHLNDCPSLKTPPKEVVSRGFQAIYGYLRRLQLGSVSCKRTKLMMVGLGGAGKTSLVRALMAKRSNAYSDYHERITDGIDINDWKVDVPGETDPLIYSVWDFAGQTVYYNTHQFFLSNRAVYLLLWNIRLGYEHAGLDFWLSSIACHAPKAPIIIVGTHCDKVEKSKIPQNDLKRKYPQIANFFFVSVYTGESIPELKKFLIQLTLQQKYMGERIPEAWLTLEKKVVAFRDEQERDLAKWEEVENAGFTCGIMDNTELVQAVQFLHDLGSLQFFNTEFLRSYVVIYPQWIVDVMKCIVTVHAGPVQEGRLAHSDMKKVWKDYDVALHPWLLRLTEEFDLTFPLEKEPVNLVPCLLPDEEQNYEWPAVDPSKGIHETKMIYQFVYLPAGLFNRAQVRLHKYSDQGKLWQKGMFLRKNKHIAVMLQKGNNVVLVKAQGVRPENMILMVHEVFETLINQSYSGVNYDFLIPCMECSSMHLADPSMFSASKVQRANEMNAMFLQCENLFHVLSIAELQNAMPPDRSADYDSYLRQNVQELQNLGEDANISTVFCYSKKNVPSLQQESTHVHPGHIMEDLRLKGFNVSFCDNPETADMSSLTLTFKSAKVILIGISDEFCAEESCRNIIMFIKETLRLPILLVVLGKSMNWEKSNLALSISDEVYVKMNDPARYSTKIKELEECIKKKSSRNLLTEEVPEVFISYCWSNSQDAISKGTRKKEGSVGWGDPRELKKFLEGKGCSCWIDIERVGGGGLFEDIADGLRKAKVVVACVSDEYVQSSNCVMEFRFALSKLRVPVVLAVVGTGYQWERSEIGMLAVGQNCVKINFQYENLSANMELLEQVQTLLKNNQGTSGNDSKTSLEDQHKIAFKEVLELSQRQFLRHVVGYADSMSTGHYPRLIVIDMVEEEDETEEEDKKETNKEEIQKKLIEMKIAEKRAEKDYNCECAELDGKMVYCKNCTKLVSEYWEEPDVDEEEKRKAKYCYRLLCEHEEGWHPVSPTIPFPVFEDNEQEEQWLSTLAPYAARVFAILKYTNLNMACLNTPEGQTLQEKLQTIVATSNQKEFQEEYTQLRQSVMELDVDKEQGNLKRCHMMNGKTLWLCEEHRKQSGSRTEEMFRDQLSSEKKEATPAKELRPKTPRQKEPPSLKSTQQPSQSGSKKQTAVFKMRETAMSPNSDKKLKRQTSQACSVM